MSLLNPEHSRYDVFISYAGDDNRARWPLYISSCQALLRDKLAAEARAKGLQGSPEIFFDEKELPPSGDLNDGLRTAVSESAFLVIFVSEHYLDSEWCFRELEAFRNNFSGGTQETLKHLFILVIDKVDPSHKKWPGWMTDAKRIELFDDDAENPVGYPIDSEKAPEAALNTQLNRIAERMVSVATADKVNRKTDTTAQPALNFVLGAVTEDLLPTRENLRYQLEGEGKQVRSLEMNELVQVDARDIVAGTEGEVVLIQLFSFATVSYRGADGGHLGYQQDLFNRLPEGERPRTVWCYPKGESGVCTLEGGDQSEQDPRHLDYLREIEKGVQYWSPQQLTDALLTRSPSALPELYIESEKSNLELSRQMREEIERLWCDRYPETGFMASTLAWPQLQRTISGCVGVILLFRKKPESALHSQIGQLKKKLVEARKSIPGWVAVEKSHYNGDLWWDTFPISTEPGFDEPTRQHLLGVVERVHDDISHSGDVGAVH